MNNYRSADLFFICGLLFLALACNTSKNANSNFGKCEESGIVKDYSNLDGCKLLIEVENGEKYLPTNTTFNGITLKDGQRISFSYKEGEAMVSICMAEDKIIELTCLELIQETSSAESPACQEIKDPMSVMWMASALKSHQPVQVVIYPYQREESAYLFKGKDIFLYDCRGKLLCETEGAATEECLQLVKPEANGKIVWQAEGVGH